MQNYHRHTSYSNIMTPDSAVSNEDYARRAVELGQKVICSVEHGWQGYYYEVFELAEKYNLKFIFGTEAYWVKDNLKKDKTNNHIIILAKNEAGRREINSILSDANIDGYYFKPRLDEKSILSLTPGNVFITTACIAFWNYGMEETKPFVEKLHNRFGNDFRLEVQYHNTLRQKELNRYILQLKKEYNVGLIAGMDSHYILPEQCNDRDYYLEAKGISYPEEDGWYMDYPDKDEAIRRFKEQGVLNDEEIKEAIEASDVLLDFEDIILDKEIKLPVPRMYRDKTKEERAKIYSKLITKKFKEYMKHVPESEYQRYFDGIKEEVNVYKNTEMCDYPLINYEVIKKGVEMGGIITKTGRGSAPSFMTNTLCGFSNIDRFISPIKLYPERFMSETRILQTHSLPDIDFNLGTPEIFEKAQEIVMGEGHSYPMIAFGTLKKKGAFKMFARAVEMNFTLANEISKQIDAYETDLKNAEEEDKDTINIFDYIDPKYHDYIKQSEKYWGIISDKKKAPCAYLIWDGDIKSQIGLIKCKSESTKKEYITAVIDGAIAERYKFLKNDLLKVNTVLLTAKVFERIGMPHMTVPELSKAVDGDEKTWQIYAKGATQGINQCEQESAIKKVVRYKPRNISELAAFIAGIRPGFKTMYDQFESRRPFEYGIKPLDDLLQTEQFPYSYILYQEQLMAVLNFAGFPMDQCYQIIKDIAKKHPEKVLPLKDKFLEGFAAKILPECSGEAEANKMAQKVWQVIYDNTAYGFNCVSGNTRIQRGANNGKWIPTVEEMYKVMNDKSYAEATGHLSLYDKYHREGYGTALSMYDDLMVRKNRIVDIVQSGIKQTYEIKTKTGKSIICTANHRFPTPSGKKRLDELSVGDEVYCKGEYQKSSKIYTYEKGIPTYVDIIESITPTGEEMTYDIEMADPAHTFISEDGLVVSNCSHAYAMSLDSLYGAWQKAHYPYEFYEVYLQFYTEEGKKDKVAALKQEMESVFGIKEGAYKWGVDNRRFKADPEHHQMIPALTCIKGISAKCAEAIYKISTEVKTTDFIDLLELMNNTPNINKKHVSTLIRINYFEKFGNIQELILLQNAYEDLDRSQFNKVSNKELISKYGHIIVDNAEETAATYKNFKKDIALRQYAAQIKGIKISLSEKIDYEYEFFGYIRSRFKCPESYAYVIDVNKKYKNKVIKLHRLSNGEEEIVKVKGGRYDANPIEVKDVIKTISAQQEKKWKPDGNGGYKRIDELETILYEWSKVNVK